MKREIMVEQTVTALHCWPGAPGMRSYLRNPHRHDFKVWVWLEVGHNDREIEFHNLQDALLSILQSLGETRGAVLDYGSMSCEEIAERVINYISEATRVQVFEDDRCGAELTKRPKAVWPDLNPPEIVTICGSTRFKDEHGVAMKKLEDEGKAVFMVGSFMHADGLSVSEEMKRAYDELHLQKISISDGIYVLNVGGYIGESTAREIAFAKRLGKRVEYLEARGD